MKHIPLLLIGLGAHAKRIYYKIARRDGEAYGFSIVCILDVDTKKRDIESFLLKEKDTATRVVYISNYDKADNSLKLGLIKLLNNLVNSYGIRGVIIATDPEAHVAYARWALSQGLSILMDKPVSVHLNSSTNPRVPKLILSDYEVLLSEYQACKKQHPDTYFSLMAQRRFHPAFQKMKSLIEDVQKRTGCPITSIQSFHGDGQWRLPDELVDIPYHGYTNGYGKCSHSGYHFFDTISWLLEAGEGKQKDIDSVTVSANVVRPSDYLKQITPKDYEQIFKKESFLKASTRAFKKKILSYGEIDAFCSFAFKQKEKTMTLGSVNLIHNSFSQRGWYSTINRDLYKGNGRLRHETHIIEQGPFQAIEFISLQSEEVRPGNRLNLFKPGGEYHLDIHVFRNHALFSDWHSYEKISLADLTSRKLENHSRGHQEDARRTAVLEFISLLHGSKKNPISDFSDHRRSVMLLMGVYQSIANQFVGKNHLITLPFSKNL